MNDENLKFMDGVTKLYKKLNSFNLNGRSL